MGGTMSRNKGQRSERQVIQLLQPVVIRVWEWATGQGIVIGDAPILQRNTLQSDRGGFDIVGLDWLALEVKHQETLAVEKWWQQTVEQATNGKEPVLFYKQNNVKFRVRIWALVWIHGHGGHLDTVVEMSVESFLDYFEKRLRAELQSRGSRN